MKIKKIYLHEGLFNRNIPFENQFNLVHSERNSKGKTTLLRYLLYALGFSIPNTKNMKFKNDSVEVEIETDKSETFILKRAGLNAVQLEKDGDEQTFVLPDQLKELHRIVFGVDNNEILDNLLGSFYVDQEKGWTLLNRGVVIGSIRFNIEDFISGFTNSNDRELKKQEKILASQLGKYRQMFNIAQYKEQISFSQGHLITENYDDFVDGELNSLLIEQKEKRDELQRIDQVLSENKRLKQFISKMHLLISTPSGNIEVTDDKIVGLNDSVDYLVAKRKFASAAYKKVTKKIEDIQKEKAKDNERQTFLDVANLAVEFDKRISKLPLNAVAIKNKISELEKELKKVRQSRSNTANNSSVALSISADVVRYMTDLEVNSSGKKGKISIFTSNLRELSGAVLHKTVFAFKLAYINAIRENFNVLLPIILDSPSGKEVDRENIHAMMQILKRDFADHQVIIASIFEYEDLENVNKIEIVNRLIE